MRKTQASIWILAATVGTVALLFAMPIQQRTKVATETIRRGTFRQTLSVEGTVMYANQTVAVATSAGKVSHVLVQEGDEVRKGDLLCQMDTSVEEAALEQAMALQQQQIAAVSDLPQTATAFAVQMQAETIQQVQTMKAAIQLKQIRAQSDGVIEQVYARDEQYVAAASPLLSLRGQQPMLVATMLAQEALQLKRGMSAIISVEGRTIGAAQVAAFQAPTTINGVICQTVEFTVEQGQEALLDCIGKNVDIDIVCSVVNDAVLVPLEALSDEQTIWVIRDRTAVEISVEPDERNAETFVVAEALENETVVLHPDADKLYDGCAVKEAKP